MANLTVHRRLRRQVPWLLGIVAAPLLMGGVTVESQVITGFLISLGLFLNVTDLPIRTSTTSERWAVGFLLILILFPLVPLPVDVVALIAPERARLAKEFAIPDSDGQWIPLTLSSARSVHRIWELLMVFAVYWLSKQAMRNPAFPRALALTIGLTVGFLAISDVLLRIFGKNMFLGTGQTGWGTAAGTFANRNHFASWIYVGSLFSFGWILRNTLPIQRTRNAPVTEMHLHQGDVPGLTLPIVFGLVMAILSGSRGGFITFVIGCFVWLVLMTHRGGSKLRFQLMGGFICLLLFVAWAAGDTLFFRMNDVLADLFYKYPKIPIWKEALGVIADYPIFGVGAGSFVWAYNHYKTGWGESTFWHAENDYLQMTMEFGIPAALLMLIWLIRVSKETLSAVISSKTRLQEPELVIGAIAAIAAFSIHAMFEFVLQIESLALLMAAILGFIRGTFIWKNVSPETEFADRAPFRRGPLALGLVIFSTAVVLAISTSLWHMGLQRFAVDKAITNLTRSLKIWPFAADRQIALSRIEISALEENRVKENDSYTTDLIRKPFHRAMRIDPFNWGLRLEGAWIELAFSPDRERALKEAENVARLNRLQPQIPMRFARYFAYSDPELAIKFLKRIPRNHAHYFRESLQLVWEMTGNATDLWAMTPDRAENLLILGEFAIDHNLPPMATSAYRLLDDRVEPIPLSDLFIEAGAPGDALRVLNPVPTSNSKLARVAAAAQLLGQNLDAIRAARSVWENGPLTQQIFTEERYIGLYDEVVERWRQSSDNPYRARVLLAAISKQKPERRDLELTKTVSELFPKQPKIQYLAYTCFLEASKLEDAALCAVRLAMLSARLEESQAN